MPRLHHTITLLLLASLWTGVPAVQADELQVRPDHPDRYVVVQGDTLWDIAAKFLNSPWHWPKIWNVNPEVRTRGDKTRTLDNPHLIYPGDVLVFRDGKLFKESEMAKGEPPTVVTPSEGEVPPDGGPASMEIAPDPGISVTREEEGERRKLDTGYVGRTVRLRPKIHEEAITEAIPTIPPEAIAPFLNTPLVVGRRELRKAGYVTLGQEGRIIIGDNTEFYARGLPRLRGKQERELDYRIFRQGEPLKDPDTGRTLAYEAIYLGEAHLVRDGDPAKFTISSIRKEIFPKDRLLIAPKKRALPYYQPRPPKKDVKGWIIAADDAVTEIGPNTVVAISLGREDGMEEGTVLRIMRHAGSHHDPVTGKNYQLPDESTGLLLIFRTHDEVSYGLVMQATRSVHLFDRVVTP